MPDSHRVIRLTISAMVLMGGIALCLALLAHDSTPSDDLAANRDPLCEKAPETHDLLDPAMRWRTGLPLAAWYLLAGPTIAGPVLVWLHRKALVDKWLLSGKGLWIGMGVLVWIVILASYLPCLIASTFSAYDFQWKDHYPAIATSLGLLHRARFLMALLTLIAIPALTLVAAIASASRLDEFRKLDWMDRTGLMLGCLWWARNAWYIIMAIIHFQIVI